MYLIFKLFITVLLGTRRLAADRKLLRMRRGSTHKSSFRHNRSFRLNREGGGSKYDKNENT